MRASRVRVKVQLLVLGSFKPCIDILVGGVDWGVLKFLSSIPLSCMSCTRVHPLNYLYTAGVNVPLTTEHRLSTT